MDKELISLITGGGRGIGRSISKRLAKDLPVLIIGRTESDLIRTSNEINELGMVCKYLASDITSSTIASDLIKILNENNWSISSLVLNAGIGKSGSLQNLDIETFGRIINVNLISTLPLVKIALPEMIKRKSGTICYISSIAGLKGIPYDSAYSAAKHAQIGLAKSLAAEYGKHGISVVPICPSFVESEMTDRSIASLSQRKGIEISEARKIIENLSPQKRIINPDEVSEVVAFVCSGKVPSLSGNPIILNGGLS